MARPAVGSLGAMVVVVLLGVVGGALLSNALPHGIGVSSDSILYLTGAENLGNGMGWSRPSGEGTQESITHFPPLYSLVLAAAAGPHGDPAGAAVTVAVLLFSGVIVVSGAALIYIQRDPAAGVLVGALLASSPILMSVFSWAMSEPLFLLLGLLSLALLVAGLQGDRLGLILASGAAAGLAYLTRYVGAALILTGLLLILLRRGASRRANLTALAAFAAPALVGVAAWSLRNLTVGGTVTNRSLVWHSVSLTKWKSPLSLLWGWLLPLEFDYAALLATGAVLLILLALGTFRLVRTWSAIRHSIEDWRRHLSFVGATAAFLGVYSATVALSLMFVDAATPIDDRIAAPVYVGLMVILCAAWAHGLRRTPRAWIRAVLLVMAGILIVSYSDRTRVLTEGLKREGQGYASEGWQRAPIVAAARELPPSALYYTNNKEAFTFFTGVGAYGLPVERDNVTGKANPVLAEDLDRILHRLGESGGAVVLFGGPEVEAEWRYLAPLLSELELHVAVSDGRIYTAPDRG